jgi:hypothetical protein
MNEELLDNEEISNHSSDIQIKNGSSFSFRIKGLAILILFMGVLTTSVGGFTSVIGLALIFAAIFIITSRYGVDISLSTNYVREYHKRFFIKKGKWLPLAAYSDICILKIRKTRTTSDITGVASTKLDASKNEVYLMTYDHRRRFLLKICKSQKEAIAFAEEMCETLEKKLSIYNPKISQKTQQRLRFRK